jgi:CubicO group peptidase (beta-lactamase class C family)
MRWIVLLLLLPGCRGTPPVRGSAETVDSLGVLLRALADSSGVPGLSVAIARDGRIVLASATGLADRERRIAATPHTVYRIGSVSKLLTAAVAGRLADRGILAWDADIRSLVGELPPERPPMTARQLAEHTAGIRHYRPREFINTVPHDSVASAVRAFVNDSLLFSPGSRYGYSSFGYVLLSLVLERAARQPFLALVEHEVLGSLRLRETGPDRPDSLIRNRAVPYDGGAGNPIVPARADDLSNRWAAGGFLSSVMDLVRFGSAFASPGFLSDSTLRAMTTARQLPSGSVSPVGIGWRIGKDADGRTIWHHAGTALGGRAILVVWPDQRIVVAIAGNLLFSQNERAATRFADLVR